MACSQAQPLLLPEIIEGRLWNGMLHVLSCLYFLAGWWSVLKTEACSAVWWVCVCVCVCVCLKNLSGFNISQNTQRAFVVGYAARAQLAVYRIGLAWQTWSGAGCSPYGVGDPGNQRELGVRRRWPRTGVHRRWPEKPPTVQSMTHAASMGIGLPETWQPAVSENASTPSLLRMRKYVFITEWSVGRGGRGSKQCRPPSPWKMQPNQNEGKHAQFGTKWWLILQCAQEIKWMVWLGWSCLVVNHRTTRV